ncbi:ribbon-helix-helix protein, CopG family [Pseudomonas sp. PSPC3-3]|uniref:ribbon-helix-helix protein, CopG family n=1 Tax=unclassified Pseudomonas TaxID=196821 RepID=UPI003CECA845
MAIIERAKRTASANPEATIAASKAAATAPDAVPRIKKLRGKREMFQVGFEPELLAELDAERERLGGISRPALLKIALRRLLDSKI